MRKLIITAALVLSTLAWSPLLRGLESDESCKINGGSTGLAGENCPTTREWYQVTFSVTAVCHNSCTGGTWTKDSGSLSMQSELSCQSCPLKQGCTDCIRRISDQSIEYYTEVVRQKQMLFSGCAFKSSMRAVAACYCPGCGDASPILISLTDRHYELTDAAHGVRFDLDGDGEPEQTAWTAAGADEGFLALDRNLNGQIDDFLEVFGDHTPQLPSDEPNGWLALAVWDDSLNGGNEDGLIDSRDEIFGALLIWVDANHNGFSEPGELSSLQAAGIEYLSLDYDSEHGWVDAFGNGFRYPSSVGRSDGTDQTAWDVFFGTLQ